MELDDRDCGSSMGFPLTATDREALQHLKEIRHDRQRRPKAKREANTPFRNASREYREPKIVNIVDCNLRD